MEVWRESRLVFDGTVVNLRVGAVTPRVMGDRSGGSAGSDRSAWLQ